MPCPLCAAEHRRQRSRYTHPGILRPHQEVSSVAKGVPVKVSRRSAEQAVRVLLRWAGEDPAREGLIDTPKRVVDAYQD